MTTETLELAQKLIRFQTDILHQTEEPCARFVADLLTAEGFSVTEHEFLPGRVSLVATVKGQRRRKPPLGFTGHLDVVPAETGS